MSQEYEELVEEIRGKLMLPYGLGITDGAHGLRDGYADTGATASQMKRWARRIISRILSAVEDGMPLPREAGRIRYNLEGHQLKDLGFKVGDTLIALRSEEKE